MISLIEKLVILFLSLVSLALGGLACFWVLLLFESPPIEKLKISLFILILSQLTPLALDWAEKSGLTLRIERIGLFVKNLVI